jgi:hypothetical protein
VKIEGARLYRSVGGTKKKEDKKLPLMNHKNKLKRIDLGDLLWPHSKRTEGGTKSTFACQK